jgi:hypothetical protein
VALSKQVTHNSPRLGLTTTLINKPPPHYPPPGYALSRSGILIIEIYSLLIM